MSVHFGSGTAIKIALLALGCTLSGAVAPALASGAAGPSGRLVIVQAVPRDALDVTIDGHTVQQDSTVGAILGPVTVSAGRHRVGFTDASGALRLTSMVEVRPDSSSDIVVHLPAAVGGPPVVNAYRTPRAPIAPGKARVLIAHTATVAPADVRVDGKVVFHDIANGEYATADLAAGAHTVALLPAGLTSSPILGPLHVDLQAGTVTMVYAVGNPRDGSMKVISHTAELTSNGAVVPESIDTGTAGLAAGITVQPFGGSAGPRAEAGSSPRDAMSWSLVMGGALLSVVALLVVRPRRRAPIRPR
jgi:hypothetical protein